MQQLSFLGYKRTSLQQGRVAAATKCLFEVTVSFSTNFFGNLSLWDGLIYHHVESLYLFQMRPYNKLVSLTFIDATMQPMSVSYVYRCHYAANVWLCTNLRCHHAANECLYRFETPQFIKWVSPSIFDATMWQMSVSLPLLDATMQQMTICTNIRCQHVGNECLYQF